MRPWAAMARTRGSKSAGWNTSVRRYRRSAQAYSPALIEVGEALGELDPPRERPLVGSIRPAHSSTSVSISPPWP